MSVSLLVFANSMAKDYLPVTLDRLKQHFPKIKSYFAIDCEKTADDLKSYYEFDEIIIYDKNKRWTEKMASILAQIHEKYVFFLIDNNIFIDKFEENILLNYVNIMEANAIDQLRMIPSGVTIQTSYNDINIYKIDNTDYIFSVQPAIWNKEVLNEIIVAYIELDYNTIELSSKNYTSRFNNYFIYTEKDIQMQINNFSFGCPFIHALTAGKWVNETEFYSKNIEKIKDEYNFDISKRGLIFLKEG